MRPQHTIELVQVQGKVVCLSLNCQRPHRVAAFANGAEATKVCNACFLQHKHEREDENGMNIVHVHATAQRVIILPFIVEF